MRFFEMIVGSFHSVELYRRIRREASFNLLYTLGLVFICCLMISVYYGNVLHRELFVARDGKPAPFDSMVTQIGDQLPIMTFKDGRLMTKDPQATVITVSGELFEESFENVPLITIDTTGQSTHLTMKTPMLITADELIIKTDKETKIQPLSEFSEGGGPSTLLINKAMAQEAAAGIIDVVHRNLTQFYLIAGGIVWFVFALFAYVMRIFMLLVLGLFGLLIGSLLKSPLEFGASVSLAAVSFTPIALLETGLLIGFGYPVHTITLFIAGLVALGVAIKVSAPAPANPMVV